MGSYYLPGIIYESLPVMYTFSGVTSVVSFGEGIGAYSGALLAIMGVVVWTLRWQFRRSEAL